MVAICCRCAFLLYAATNIEVHNYNKQSATVNSCHSGGFAIIEDSLDVVFFFAPFAAFFFDRSCDITIGNIIFRINLRNFVFGLDINTFVHRSHINMVTEWGLFHTEFLAVADVDAALELGTLGHLEAAEGVDVAFGGIDVHDTLDRCGIVFVGLEDVEH